MRRDKRAANAPCAKITPFSHNVGGGRDPKRKGPSAQKKTAGLANAPRETDKNKP